MKSWIAEAANRENWLKQVVEEPVRPDLEIVDPHHHLWCRNGTAYELEKLWADTMSGHNIVQTVFVECHSGYYSDVADGFAPVGETAYVAGLAALSHLRPQRPQVAGIVAHADLRRDNLGAILDAHERTGGNLFKGIRHALAWTAEPNQLRIQPRGENGLAQDPDFQRGLAESGRRGLTYDS